MSIGILILILMFVFRFFPNVAASLNSKERCLQYVQDAHLFTVGTMTYPPGHGLVPETEVPCGVRFFFFFFPGAFLARNRNRMIQRWAHGSAVCHHVHYDPLMGDTPRFLLRRKLGAWGLRK